MMLRIVNFDVWIQTPADGEHFVEVPQDQEATDGWARTQIEDLEPQSGSRWLYEYGEGSGDDFAPTSSAVQFTWE